MSLLYRRLFVFGVMTENWYAEQGVSVCKVAKRWFKILFTGVVRPFCRWAPTNRVRMRKSSSECKRLCRATSVFGSDDVSRLRVLCHASFSIALEECQKVVDAMAESVVLLSYSSDDTLLKTSHMHCMRRQIVEVDVIAWPQVPLKDGKSHWHLPEAARTALAPCVDRARSKGLRIIHIARDRLKCLFRRLKRYPSPTCPSYATGRAVLRSTQNSLKWALHDSMGVPSSLLFDVQAMPAVMEVLPSFLQQFVRVHDVPSSAEPSSLFWSGLDVRPSSMADLVAFDPNWDGASP
eukprot:2018189-Amphidinium_carterae.1